MLCCLERAGRRNGRCGERLASVVLLFPVPVVRGARGPGLVLYSCRRARIGSTVVARRAGTVIAMAETISSRHETEKRVSGSVGVTSNKRLRRTRVRARVDASP